jgi:tetratricopeptide (TPR) repeat protein
VATTLTNLGNAYGSLGDTHKSRELLERALAIKERHYGLDHTEVAPILGSLGNAYGSLGDAQKSRELLERALAIEERHYGLDHPVVATTLTNLGIAYYSLGDTHKSRELLERALAIKERHYGLDHQKFLSIFLPLLNCFETPAVQSYTIWTLNDLCANNRKKIIDCLNLFSISFNVFIYFPSFES